MVDKKEETIERGGTSGPVLDFEKLNEVYQLSVNEAKRSIRPNDQEVTAGHRAAFASIDLGSAVKTFCDDWPEIEGFLKTAIGLGGLWPPAHAMAAKAKAAIKAIDAVVIPAVCGAAPAPAPAPLGGGRRLIGDETQSGSAETK